MEPLWKQLVEELKAQGHQSPYLDRLRERLPATFNTFDLQREMLQEMAHALGKAEDKVNLALLKLELRERDVVAQERAEPKDAAWRRELNARITAYNAQRDEAVTLLWELTVHREAIGLRCDQNFRDYYPVPPPRHHVG
ncbi:MAG: hypothetical protein AB2A00_28700 [Myxococcota bacterium]